MLVYGHELAAWAQEKMPGRLGFDAPFCVGVINENQLGAVIVYDNYRPAVKSISVSIVVEDKKVLTRKLLKTLFAYPFFDLQCRRIQAIIDEKNNPSIKLCRQLGFAQEGILRKASPIEGNDLLIFGMLKEECKWLSGKTT